MVGLRQGGAFGENPVQQPAHPAVRGVPVGPAMPDLVNHGFGQLHGHPALLKRERGADALGKPRGNRGDQIGLQQHVTKCHVVGDRQADAALQAQLLQLRLDPAMAGALGLDPDMLACAEAGLAPRPCRSRVAGAQQADVALAKQHLLEEPGLQLGQPAQGQIDPPVSQRGGQIDGGRVWVEID